MYGDLLRNLLMTLFNINLQIYLVINFVLQSYFQRTKDKDKSVDLICMYMINPKQEIQAYANTFFTNMNWNRHVHY